MELIAPIVLTGIVLVGLMLAASMTWRKVAGMALVSPVFVFLGSVLVRACGGLWLQVIQPMEKVIRGEFEQYVIARRYISEVSWMWAIYILGILTILWLARQWIKRSSRRYSSGVCSGDFFIVEKLFRVNGKDGRLLVGNAVIATLTFFVVEGVIGIVSGSTDRGENYAYWAQQAFKPVSLFVGLARLKQLAYFMVPICLQGARNKARRCLLIVVTGLSIAPGIVNGSRGELLYPLAMLTLGTVIALRAKKRAIFAGIMVIALMLPVVAYVAAYRDNPKLYTTPSKDLAGRISLIVNGVSKERFDYRVSALGREIYACSDAFVFKPENIDKRIGFGDLDFRMMKKMLIPRLVSSNRGFEKLDGSRVAQDLIGTQINGWFPCLSTPADLWRRGGPVAVFAGGTVVGAILIICELVWMNQLRSKNNMFAVFCIGFPATYYQFPLSGTVREIVWLVGWEFVKYIAFLLVITRIVEGLMAKSDKYSAGTRQ